MNAPLPAGAALVVPPEPPLIGVAAIAPVVLDGVDHLTGSEGCDGYYHCIGGRGERGGGGSINPR